jgi:plasmid stabilization system protein ParE
MMNVVFREQARTDMRNVMAWFRDQRDGSEMRFEAAFEAELGYIRQYPIGYQTRRPPFRFAMVDRFKYFIIYAVVGNVVVIHRIRHPAARDRQCTNAP